MHTHSFKFKPKMLSSQITLQRNNQHSLEKYDYMTHSLAWVMVLQEMYL